MFKKYDTEVFEKFDNQKNVQHNIFVLVGNGFDISVLNKFKKGKMNGKTTSYADFYDYITYFNLSDHTNILYEKMKEDRRRGKENWSDFENTISELFNEHVSIKELETCIDKFQAYFTKFLGMSSKVCKFLIERNIFGSSVRPAHQYRVDSSQSPSSEWSVPSISCTAP